MLLLQGPMGPFFANLADVLEQHGIGVSKVHFNGGDAWFYGRRPADRYNGTLDQWSGWLAQRLQSRRIDAIVLFGQVRPVHEAAIAVARELGVRCYVFEEGYLRPDFVTLETGGVNAWSPLPREAKAYGERRPRMPKPAPTGQRFRRTAWIAIQYSFTSTVARPFFGSLPHHRALNPITEPLRWVRSGLRKLRYAWSQRHELARLCAPETARRWYLFPLQVANDSQVTHHSPFGSMTTAIDAVLASFADHAPADTHLVVKHHPMDRAYSDYSSLLRQRAREFGLEGRIHYVHDLHLPTLLRHTRGVVTVNSTVGLQAMYHRAPVCVLGESFYAIPGLVHGAGLSSFWRTAAVPDAALFARFRAHLQRHTQLNASFYAAAPGLAHLLAAPVEVSRPQELAPLGSSRRYAA
ncbi:capsule biosynthesis protein [Rivibacter subsaxonicus]|uniref:Capsular polysaccharide export protein n=1 Tax=Rivibacter subsaxonicus TaxID=457575 RepID=A0A4Q7VMQ0_9BURK|nr:capsular biosynthesis protein [Rivibacter subsaxonicus]RZT97601.1 capsular polysaccharide export protein [Rivibacter subsaxonicus]